MTTDSILSKFHRLTPSQLATAQNAMLGQLAQAATNSDTDSKQFASDVLNSALAFVSPQPVCAHCDQEAGVTRPAGTSHGICERHAAEVLEEYNASWKEAAV